MTAAGFDISGPVSSPSRRRWWSSWPSIACVFAFLATAYHAMGAMSRSDAAGATTSARGDARPIPTPAAPLPPWRRGHLDVHHIHAGSSVSTFTIFPDGTTMLTDAGDMDVSAFDDHWKRKTDRGKVRRRAVRPFPNSSKSPGGWTVDYIHRFWPRRGGDDEDDDDDGNDGPVSDRSLDFVLNTHFHEDHVGHIYTADGGQEMGRRPGATYVRSGLAHVGDEIAFAKLIDRGYPAYDYPYDLEREWAGDTSGFTNYLRFVRYLEANADTKIERFQVGSDSQMSMVRNDDNNEDGDAVVREHFAVRNIKSNLQVSPARPENRTVSTIPGRLVVPSPEKELGVYDENEVSNAIVVEYGKFRYYEGGDCTYHDRVDDRYGVPVEPLEMDAATPTAIAAGRVHVATADHHGNGIRPAFAAVLDPRVVVLQGWTNDQPRAHPWGLLKDRGPGVMGERDLFATYVSDEKVEELRGQGQTFESTLGHVVVRAFPPEPDGRQYYRVYVLDGDCKVDAEFGPYEAD